MGGRNPKLLTNYSSMLHMAGATGIPRHVLKAAKEAGCPGFNHSGPCSLAEFIKWYFVQKEEAFGETLDLNQEKAGLAKEQKLAAVRQRLIEEGEMHKRSDVEILVWQQLLLPVRQELETMPSKLGPQCNPEQPEHATKVLSDWWEGLKKLVEKEKT